MYPTMRHLTLWLLCGCFFPVAYAQQEVISPASGICPPIQFNLNTIQADGLSSFYEKLETLERTKAGVVRIYHIGDSHIQPDIFSGVIRSEFQKRYGNAGRGLIFPYQLAKSNPPGDILTSSSIKNWSYNRVATPKKGATNGICGFMIETTASTGTIQMNLDGPDSLLNFTKVQSFQDSKVGVTWQYDSMITNANNRLSWMLPLPSKSVRLTFSGNQDTVRFYGAEVSNGKSGVMVNTIGVNGATFQQYNNNPKFWQQMDQLEPGDLFILSLGSNEADIAGITDSVFSASVEKFISRVKQHAPNASIVFTTVSDYYVSGTQSNPVVLMINRCLQDLAFKRGYGFWDLLSICNGLGSAKYWIRCKLMSHDHVHFVTEGYKIQGRLLTQALLDGFRAHKTRKIK